MTKSSLVLRDIDLWATVNERSRFILMISLSTLDEGVRSRFEPRASSVQDRLRTLHVFKERGCAVGVVAMPFLPFISDSEESIRELFRELCAVGVDFALTGGLTLRPGRQKELYMSVIDEHFNDLTAAYRELYGKNRPSGTPLPNYHRDLRDVVREIQSQTRIPSRVPHGIYKRQFPLYEEILILMEHMTHIYQACGVPTDRLDHSLQRYRHWLDAEQRVFRRKRSQTSAALQEKTLALICSGQFGELVANQRLGQFFAEMVREDKVFDYCTRELQKSA
jgi:DNA repair photolyase